MREISGIEEKKNTYADFTQNILTEWIDENPEYEDKDLLWIPYYAWDNRHTGEMMVWVRD